MKTRSKSVPRIANKEILFANLGKAQGMHERISSRVYGEKYTREHTKLQVIHMFDIKNEKPPLAHSHKEKSYEKLAQSSPNTRVKKLKEARFFQSKKFLEEQPSKQSIFTTKDVSLTRQEKSYELFRQASRLVLKEKENTNNIARKSKDYSGVIKLKIQTINKEIKRIEDQGYPFIPIVNKCTMNRLRKLLN